MVTNNRNKTCIVASGVFTLVRFKAVNGTREFAAETHLLKLQRLQNKVLRTIGQLPRHTPVRDLHMAFQIPYVYDYITKTCRQQAEVIQNHENEHVRYIGQGEARHRKYKRLKLGGGHVYDRSSV
jgi:hypothetical protein